MRFMRYAMANGAELGLAASLDGTAWHGLAEDHPRFPGGLDALIAAGTDALRRAGNQLLADGARLDMAQTKVLKPLAAPGKILCIGLNYREHVRETGLPTPEHLTVFTRYDQSLVAGGEPMLRPLASTQFDYEAELAVVIGTKARNVARDSALAHVAGYTILNDGSLRDLQTRTSQWTMGKNADASGAIGPCLVLADTLPEGAKPLRISAHLNDEMVQDGDTGDMVFDVARTIEELSRVMTLMPGDIIATGTPSGVAMGQATPRWLRPGDRIAVSIEGIGTLTNPIAEGE